MSYFKEAVNAIEEFSHRFRENPWDYLYESDVQFELMQCLKKMITGLDLPYGTHMINVVKSEYPGSVPGGDNRFDLVAIDPSKCDGIINKCNCPVSIAMELKLNVNNKDIGAYIYNKDSCTLEKDLNKLQSLGSNVITTAGFAILCIKPYEDGMCDNALDFLKNKDKDRFNLMPIDGLSEKVSLSSNNSPIGIYAVIIDGSKNGKNHYFKLNKTSE